MGEWILFVLLAAGLLYVGVRQAKKTFAAYERLIAREGLERTATPCGLTTARVASLEVCPTGGRDHGLRFGTRGPMTLELGGDEVEVDVAAFQWWWEEYMSERDGNGRWVEKDQAVAAVRLPVPLPHVTIGQEGRLARWGLGGRDDVQVESEEFNRRFDVADHGTDPSLLVRLLSPEFQQTLVEHFDGRAVELAGDVLVVAGRPDQDASDDPELYGIIAQLPTARRDAARLASALPASFLRGLGHA